MYEEGLWGHREGRGRGVRGKEAQSLRGVPALCMRRDLREWECNLLVDSKIE